MHQFVTLVFHGTEWSKKTKAVDRELIWNSFFFLDHPIYFTLSFILRPSIYPLGSQPLEVLRVTATIINASISVVVNCILNS